MGDDEEFEIVEDVKFEIEFFLDDGSTDNITDAQAAEQIENELLPIYDAMNPFEDRETIVEVTIVEVEVEVCEALDENKNDEDLPDDSEEACEADETGSGRKRRDLGKWFKKKGKKGKKKKKK